MRVVAIDDRDAAGQDAREQLGLGVGDRLDRSELRQMHRLDGGDDAGVRAHEAHQRRDLTRIAHADLEHAVAGVGWHPRECKRHTPVVVERFDRRVGLAGSRQALPQHFLGAGLAGTAGHRDHPGVRRKPVAGGNADPFERAQRVVDAQQGAVAGPAVVRRGDNRRRRAGLERRGDEVVTVARVLEGSEQVAGRQRARVDRDAGDRSVDRAVERAAARRHQGLHSPQRGFGHGGPDGFVVAERQCRRADDLAGFVALAGDQQHVARLQQRYALPDCRGAVADLGRAGGVGENRLPDGGGLLAARIVVGDDHDIGVRCRDPAHDRPLARVAIAAAAEHADQLAGGERADRAECRLQRFRLVRIVDHREAAIVLADDVEPAVDAGNGLDRRDRVAGILAGGDGKAGGKQRVGRLVVADQAQAQVMAPAAVLDLEALGEAVAGNRREPQVAAVTPGADDPDAAPPSDLGHGLRSIVIGVDHGDAVGRQEGVEQPQLGVEIVVDRRVIVEMIAAEIGERRSLDRDAVEPALIEAVRGRLERQVGHAFLGQCRERLVQGDRVRRRQRAIGAAVGLHHADGAERRRRAPQPCEDLARELGDRGLAVGAGDGDRRRRLRREEPGRHQRQRAARVGGANDRHRDRRHGHCFAGEDRHCAFRDRILDEAAAIGASAGQGGEQAARRYRAAVGRQAADLGHPGAGGYCRHLIREV